MISREVIKAQLDLYVQGRQKAEETLERAKADVNAFNGAIEACNSLLNINDDLEKGNSESKNPKPDSKAKKEAEAT
jgi:hypothetical protein